MKRNYVFTTIILSLIFVALVFAQEDTKIEAQKLYNEGISLLKRKQTNDAIVKLNQAVEKDPTLAQAYYALGIAYKFNNNFAKAEQNYKLAIKNDDKMVSAYIYLGKLYGDEKKYDEALNTLKAALGIDPNDAKANIEAYNNALTNTTQSYVKGAANFGLGEIYKNSGDKSKAIAYYQAASKDRTWKQSALYELDLLKHE
ncbi:MAG: tetratricopeptide repeat protein [Calditrichota bacterium]